MGNCADRVVETEALEIQVLPQTQLWDLAREYQQLMLIYESGIKQVVTKFEILDNEFNALGARNPIESIQSRLKSPQSIYKKVARMGLPVTSATIRDNIHDVAGVRVICSYVSDIYSLRDMLLRHTDVRLIQEKDYIQNPKPNGYRSLHLIIETDLCMANGTYPVVVEVQLRTIAMNFWASLEHEIRYKSTDDIPANIQIDLQECAEIIAMTDRRMERIRRLSEERTF